MASVFKTNENFKKNLKKKFQITKFKDDTL